mmetsp:Transcript_29542/g.65078  ORF Transcript_29542/g.65078 Transcript_29542/m.65078 type:complete len:466 (+) Transcript_29542:105-1502(+)
MPSRRPPAHVVFTVAAALVMLTCRVVAAFVSPAPGAPHVFRYTYCSRLPIPSRARVSASSLEVSSGATSSSGIINSIIGTNNFGHGLQRNSVFVPCRSTVRLFSSTDASSSASSDSGRARVVFLGTPEVAATSLQTLYEATQSEPACPFEIVGVVTQPPKRRKRRGKETPSPVGLVAEELDIPSVLCPAKANDADFLDTLENEVRPDLCITAAYGQYLPKRFLSMPKFGTLNIHPSLLPRWRGASPVQRSLEAGDQPIGVTVLFTVSKMDAGPIVAQEEYEVGNDEQATTVLPHLFEVGTRLLLQAMPDVISGKITMDNAKQQDEEHVVNAAMIASAEGQLKVWKEDATSCHNKARGFSMWPGTYMYFQVGDDDDAGAAASDEPLRVKILKTQVLDDKVEPSNVVEMGPSKGDGLRIVCGDGSVLEVSQVQPAMRKAMDAKSFMNGMRGQTLRWIETPDEEEGNL